MSGVEKKATLAAWVRAVPAALLIFSLQGCFTIPSISGVPFRQKTVDQLEAGKTTRAEVLKWFGTPLSIAAKGGSVTIDHGVSYPPGSMVADSARYETVQADTFFELFSTKNTITDQDRIYYYQYTLSYKYFVFLGVYMNENANTHSDRLWVLIDEQTGLVKDHVFRKELWWIDAGSGPAPDPTRASTVPAKATAAAAAVALTPAAAGETAHISTVQKVGDRWRYSLSGIGASKGTMTIEITGGGQSERQGAYHPRRLPRVCC